MPALTFPKSSDPGERPGEGGGRLLNCFVEKNGDQIMVRRVPGLAAVLNTGIQDIPRGMIEVDGKVFLAYRDDAIWMTSAGGAGGYCGSLPGTGPVSWARNNRTTGGISSPDIVVVREATGAYVVTPTSVSAYPTTNTNTVLYTGTNGVPSTVNSVSFLGGFFIFTVADGRIYATGLNTLDCSPLSFATAESRADGIVRGFVVGNKFYAAGSETIEIWFNAGGTPFPLSRTATVIPVGLMTSAAVAGFEPGWNRAVLLVASDGTVRELADDQVSDPVSTPAVERFIAASNPAALEASVFTHRGHAIWALSSDIGTWCYDLTTGAWHERLSAGANRWRASRSVLANGRWLTCDILSGYVLAISDTTTTENGAALAATLESSALKDFPTRPVGAALFVDVTQSATNTVAVSWTHDGWATAIGPKTLSLAKADKAPVRVNRLGMFTKRGIRARFVVSGPDAFSFTGASVDATETRAA